MICCHNKNRYKWFQSDGHTKTYIPKSNRFLAEQLAIKKYLTLKLEELSQKLTAIKFCLNHYPKDSTKSELLLTAESGYSELLLPFFTPLSQELSDWATAEYEQNPKYIQQRTQTTISGHQVRSKSEVLIDMFLYTNQIPFRYENPLQLDEITLCPDFTIRHPQTGEYYYWEHFGKMDDPGYSKNVFSKLQLYNSHGITPSVILITTYETITHPLSAETIEKLIEHYFL